MIFDGCFICSGVVGLYEIDGVDQWMKAKKQLGMRGEVGKGAGS